MMSSWRFPSREQRNPKRRGAKIAASAETIGNEASEALEGILSKQISSLAQLIALNKAKDIVLAQLSGDIKEYINKNFSDVDA